MDPLDHWVPLTSLDEMEQTEYDVLIGGSGAGGSSVLWKLSQEPAFHGKRIAVVEAGGLLLQTHVNNIPTLARRQDEYRFNDRISTPIEKPDLLGAKEVIAFGGKTLIWGGSAIWFQPFIFDEWPISYQDISGYYDN